VTSEQHLGDSLAALIDGELSDDHRERVLAHLVTCLSCKAEVEAQRALKSAFAQCPLPAPSAGLMARLQGLPGGPTGSTPPSAGGGPAGWPQDVFPTPRRRDSLLSVPLLGGQRGFPVHRPGDGPGRSPLGSLTREQQSMLPGRPARGHRFAFAAAGAFSLAAFAIGGALAAAGPGSSPSGGGPIATFASGGGVSSSATPARTDSASREDVRLEEPGVQTGSQVAAAEAPVRYLGVTVSADMAALLAARQNSLGGAVTPLAAAPVMSMMNRSPEPTQAALETAGADIDALGVMSPR
jgi:anti-sigma factor RsiW